MNMLDELSPSHAAHQPPVSVNTPPVVPPNTPATSPPVSVIPPSTLSTPTISPAVSVSIPVSTTTSSLSSTPFSPVNPLVSAGLVPEDLSDILVTPPEDAAVCKKRTKRIVGARYLTSDDYTEMLREDERKRKEAEELKRSRTLEKEQKKKERLQKSAAKKKTEDRKKKQLEQVEGRKKAHKRLPEKQPLARQKICLDSPVRGESGESSAEESIFQLPSIVADAVWTHAPHTSQLTQKTVSAAIPGGSFNWQRVQRTPSSSSSSISSRNRAGSCTRRRGRPLLVPSEAVRGPASVLSRKMLNRGDFNARAAMLG